jgi:alpha-tubulin suppressor-like RCC1 family protein
MPQTQPSYVTKYVVEDNVISCSEKLAIPCTVKKVATYSTSILMLTTDSQVFALGTNECSQLGLPYSEQTLHEPTLVPIENITDITLKHERSLFLCENNALYGSGENEKFALGLNEEQIYTLTKVPSENYQSEKILFVTTAYSFSIIVTDNHNLFVFGNK